MNETTYAMLFKLSRILNCFAIISYPTHDCSVLVLRIWLFFIFCAFLILHSNLWHALPHIIQRLRSH